jgi:hypothetical protein
MKATSPSLLIDGNLVQSKAPPPGGEVYSWIIEGLTPPTCRRPKRGSKRSDEVDEHDHDELADRTWFFHGRPWSFRVDSLQVFWGSP